MEKQWKEKQSRKMVFTGIPVFLDPPNWQNQPGGEGGSANAVRSGGDGVVLVGGSGVYSAADNTPVLMLQRPHSELIPATVVGASSDSSTRPTLMAKRPRLSKVLPSDLSLNCPRCESTNTKFCYYNNYSLSQPRHFCKTCRRYWTKGGALRNVPVGGGCRRNKRTKNSSNNNNSSKNRSRAIETTSATSSGGATVISSVNCTGDIIGFENNPPPPTIHGFSDYSNGGTSIGLAFSSWDLLPTGAGNCSLGLDFVAPNELADNSSLGHWRMQQHFPASFSRPDGLVHIEPQLLLPFDGDGLVEHQYLGTGAAHELRGKPPSHLGYSDASIKVADNQSQNIGYWNGNGWGEFQDFPATRSSLL